MMRRVLTLGAIAIAVFSAACGVDQASTQHLAGPSELATALTVTATPDNINQDGSSRATVTVAARNAAGQPLPNLALRVDMAVGGVLKDFGTLSSRNLVTGSNGLATVIYTAPPAPPTSSGGLINTVSIVAHPVGTDAEVSSATPISADIRLVPIGVILPPPGAPTASFTASPSPIVLNQSVRFDASASTPGANASSLTYDWNFGDGGTASGQAVNHSFGTVGTFSVTLTVTNDRGVATSTTTSFLVAASGAPTAVFVVTPVGTLAAGTQLNFNADGSKAAAGHNIVSYSWNFGDGTPGIVDGTFFLVQHSYSAQGVYTVVLTVRDEVGQKTTVTTNVTVGP